MWRHDRNKNRMKVNKITFTYMYMTSVVPVDILAGDFGRKLLHEPNSLPPIKV